MEVRRISTVPSKSVALDRCGGSQKNSSLRIHRVSLLVRSSESIR
ncbi:Uncharacterised protein [Mycobacteroides abscessus subsp. abscessus]|nr:Uncharacterised protein [Mycobacteroides abscessus subsp. abscessus]